MTMLDKKIGAKLRELRMQASVGICEAARICDLEPEQYQKGEEGTRRVTPREIAKLCEKYEVPILSVFRDI